MSEDDPLGPLARDPPRAGRPPDRRERPFRLGFPGLILIAALIFGLGFASAPWFAFRALRSAAANQDIAALGDLVDYPAVRGSLRAQIRPTTMAETPPPNLWQDPIGAVRRAIQQPLQPQPPVDDYLSPAALTRMTDGLPPTGVSPRPAARRVPSLIYWDINRCRLGVDDPHTAGRRTVFTFERRGLFQWTLVQIRLPSPPAAR